MHNSSDSQRRILIIDDNRTIHSDYRKILVPSRDTGELAEAEASFFGNVSAVEAISYQVDSAFQGHEGLELVKQSISIGQPYDLAFVDMRMPPGWDGVETIERLWEEDPKLEIVICTAFSDYSWSETTQRLHQSNQMLILKKPFDSSEVSQLAAALTTKRRLAQQAALRMEELEAIVADRTKVLRQAHQESERLLSAISSLLIGVDGQGMVRRWNASAEGIFTLKSADVLGRHFGDLEIEWNERDVVMQLLTLQPGCAESRLEVEFRNCQGDSRVLGLSVYPVELNGSHSATLFLGIDITEHRVLEQQLHQAQKLEAVGQLAAGVAHEINTPMQYVGDNLDFFQSKMSKLDPIVNNFVSVLQIAERCGDLSDDENGLLSELQRHLKKLKVKNFMGQVTEAINDSREGIQHVSRIVRAMKDFAHPGHEDKTPVDINRALESTIAVSTNEWKYVAEITKELDPSIPLVPALAGELNQVFLNILVNAAHAIGDTNDQGNKGSKGTITVTTRNTKDVVEVAIADSGTGMTNELRQRIFDPFFTTKDVGKGTGQGLSIAHNVVVNKHGGTLQCDSTPGIGTTFVIRLPVSSEVAQANSELQPLVVGE